MVSISERTTFRSWQVCLRPDLSHFAGKRVLVTGVTGMVGATLSRSLIGAGASVHGIVRPESNTWRIDSAIDEMELHVADLLDGHSLKRAVNKVQPSVIYHLATARRDTSSADRTQTMRVNVDGLWNLFEATATLTYERFIVASSSLVCGKQSNPIDESCEMNPSTYYSETKAKAEVLTRDYAATSGKPLVVLRLFSVYGEWESPHRLIPTAMMCALSGRPLRLTAPGYRRDLVFVHDVVDTFSLATAATGLGPGEVINIGTGVQTANEETVRLVEDACGRKIDLIGFDYPPRETDTQNWVANPAKVHRVLGWLPRHTVREGIEKTVSWMRTNTNAYRSGSTEAGRLEPSTADALLH